MTADEMPKRIGVCRFVDGTYEANPTNYGVAPATDYIREDSTPATSEAMDALVDITKLCEFVEGLSTVPSEEDGDG